MVDNIIIQRAQMIGARAMFKNIELLQITETTSGFYATFKDALGISVTSYKPSMDDLMDDLISIDERCDGTILFDHS